MWVAHGEILQSIDLGEWLRDYLAQGDYQPEAVYMSLDSASVSNHLISLAAGLSPEDVAFQLKAEAQSLLPPYATEVFIDYSVDPEHAATGERRYLVQAVSRLRVEALQRVGQCAGLKVLAIESRHDAAHRAEMSHVLTAFPQASAALALQCDEAFGLALRAWHEEGANFLPHREDTQHALRRAWLVGMSVCAMGGAFLAAGFAMVLASAAHSVHPYLNDMTASTRALDDAQNAHAHAKALEKRHADQYLWLGARQELQSQSLQWSRVLSQAAKGIWVASVKQQGTRWTVQGEALSSTHAQRLVQQLKVLDIWAHAPELPQLQVLPVVSSSGLPVWQFRIEADLKVGV
jgi:hypothetical protein